MNVTKQLYQWDTGQKLTECTGIYVDYLIGDEVYRVEITDGTCIIPDELLQTSGRYKVWECMADNTLRDFAFKVLPRPMPPSYVFTPTEQLTFDGLVQKVDDAVAEMIRRADSGEFTPVKGVDYFTEAEVQQFQSQVTEQTRADIDKLKSDLDGLSLIDLGEIVDGYYVSSGYGTMPSYNTYSRTDKINVENISKIAIYVGTNTDGVGGAFYSKNEESITDGFISGVNFGGHTIGETLIVDVPSGAKYFALSSNTVNKDKMFIRIVSLKQTLDNIVEKLSTKHISYDIDLGTLVDGFVNSKYGKFNSASSYKRTDFIPIVGKTITVTDTFDATEVGFAFYDSYYQFISGFDGTGHNRGDVIKVEIPNNAKYFAYCSPNNLVGNMKVSIFDIADAIIPNYDNPIEYKGNDIVAFNKILCIGDSMTEGTFNKRVDGVNTAYIDTRYAYPTLLKAMTNRDITNKGSGGESTKSWYNLHKNDDLSGHDACIIALGINDGHGTSSVQTTSEERITALNNIIAKVKAENKGIKIFLSTIFNTYKASIDEEINADIRTVANSTEDVYLVDMAIYGNLIKEVTGVYSDTATHLTAIGYRKLAQGYFAYISYIMSKNANDFAFVHFAGTDNAYQ